MDTSSVPYLVRKRSTRQTQTIIRLQASECLECLRLGVARRVSFVQNDTVELDVEDGVALEFLLGRCRPLIFFSAHLGLLSKVVLQRAVASDKDIVLVQVLQDVKTVPSMVQSHTESVGLDMRLDLFAGAGGVGMLVRE